MGKKMKILFAAESFYPYVGGVEKHVLGLSMRLLKDGHKVTVLTYKKNKNDIEIETNEGIKIIRLNTDRNKYMNYAGLVFQLLVSGGGNGNFDIVHYHDYSIFNILNRILSLKWNTSKSKTYITFHGWEGIYPIPEDIIRKRKYCEEKANANICVGDFIEKWYGTKANIVTYGAVEASNREAGHEKIILYAGRLEADTGFDAIMKAFDEIQKEKNEYKFVVCGKGSLDYLFKGRKDVEYKGWVEDTSEYLARAEVVFASGYLSMLEAFIMKKKVICYYNNDLKKDYFEMIPGYEKMMWTAGSKEEIIRAFNEAISDNGKARAGYEFAKEYTWEKLKEDYYRLWKL